MPLVPATSLMNIINTPIMVVMTHARNNTLDWAIWRLSDQFKFSLSATSKCLPQIHASYMYAVININYSHVLGTWWIILYKSMPYMDPHTSFPQISVTQVPLQPPCTFANVDHTYSLTSLHAIVMAFGQQPPVMSKLKNLHRQKWRPYKVRWLSFQHIREKGWEKWPTQ